MESFTLAHVPQDLSVVYTALYTSVTNSAEIRKRIVAAATAEGEAGDRGREAVDFAFIDAKLVSLLILSSKACKIAAAWLPDPPFSF